MDILWNCLYLQQYQSRVEIMDIQFVSDKKGRLKAVQLSLKEWRDIERKLEAYELAESIKVGYKEMERIESGELKTKSFEEFINEL